MPFIGQERYCDLALIAQGEGFQIATQFMPNNFAGVIRGEGHLRAEFEAEGDNGTSPRATIEFAWDGLWAEDDREMMEHMVVSVVASRDD